MHLTDLTYLKKRFFISTTNYNLIYPICESYIYELNDDLSFTLNLKPDDLTAFTLYNINKKNIIVSTECMFVYKHQLFQKLQLNFDKIQFIFWRDKYFLF